MISRLCATDGVSDDEAAGLSMALLFAGHETTVVHIGLGTLLLLTNPDQWQALVDDPGLVPNAVEEMLRAPGKGGSGRIPRYARTDLDIEGHAIPAGDLVLLDNGAGNHDSTAFPDPDRVDIGRSGPAHLTFGYGIRYCLGAPPGPYRTSNGLLPPGHTVPNPAPRHRPGGVDHAARRADRRPHRTPSALVKG